MDCRWQEKRYNTHTHTQTHTPTHTHTHTHTQTHTHTHTHKHTHTHTHHLCWYSLVQTLKEHKSWVVNVHMQQNSKDRNIVSCRYVIGQHRRLPVHTAFIPPPTHTHTVLMVMYAYGIHGSVSLCEPYQVYRDQWTCVRSIPEHPSSPAPHNKVYVSTTWRLRTWSTVYDTMMDSWARN